MLDQVETTYSKLSYEELGPTPYPGVCLHSMRWQNYFITELGKPFDLGITDGPAMETNCGQVCLIGRVRWRALAIDVALLDGALHLGCLSPRATNNMQRYVSSFQMDMQGPRPSVLVLYTCSSALRTCFVLPIRIPLYGQRIIDQSIRSYHGPNRQIMVW